MSQGIEADLKSTLDVILAVLSWSGVVAEFALFWQKRLSGKNTDVSCQLHCRKLFLGTLAASPQGAAFLHL